MAIAGALVSGINQVGTNFNKLVSGKPNAPIKKAQVGLPNRGDYGTPGVAPTVGDPTRGSYGTPSTAGIAEAAGGARRALKDINNPTGSEYFKSLLGAASQTQAAGEASTTFAAKEAGQRSGYANADAGREAHQARLSNLAIAQTGAGKDAAELAEKTYGTAESAFVGLQTSYNQAKQAGDTAYAQDLTQTHLANAQNFLQNAGLNMNQQLTFAKDLNEAKGLQAKLDQDFNNSLIANNQYIEQSQQIAAQLAMQQAALRQHAYEFDVGQKTHKEDRAFAASEHAKDARARAREFDVSQKTHVGDQARASQEHDKDLLAHDKDLLANTNTAQPLRDELRPHVNKKSTFGSFA